MKSRSDRRYTAFLLSGLGRFADVDAEDAPVPITPSSLTQSMASPVACGAAWCEGGGAVGVVGEHVFARRRAVHPRMRRFNACPKQRTIKHKSDSKH